MVYKVIYIEDLDPDTRILTLERSNFQIECLKPSGSIDEIVATINDRNPDLIILDYILTEGSSLKYCNAPTIASTLRSLSVTEGQVERPIVLMSTQKNIVDTYRKDYTSHDLFDYAITKISATKDCPDKFVAKCIAFVDGYQKIIADHFNLSRILDCSEDMVHSKLSVHFNTVAKSPYEYSRFIFEHIIRCPGLLIGEDFLSARLGVSKESRDWDRLKEELEPFKYKGIFRSVYNRWWMGLIETWWSDVMEQRNSLRHSNAMERVEILSRRLKLDLSVATSSAKNLSTNYWTVCKETNLPLDPFDGIELLEEDFKPWQDKDYISIDGYLHDIDRYSKIVSEIDKMDIRRRYSN